MKREDIFDTAKAYHELLQSGTDWADKNAAADLLEESKHSVLSQCKLQSGATSDAARETEARASQRYQDFVKQMCEARRQANRARVRYDAVRTLAELRRTEESTRRQEMAWVQRGGAG